LTSGVLELDGNVYSPRSPQAAMAAGVCYVCEDRKAEGIIPSVSVVENVLLPVLSRFSRYGVLRRREARRAALEVLRRMNVRGDLSKGAAALSGGNQQKVALARLLHQDPDILLLDEPARGIDIGSKADIYREIARLASEGKGIVMVSSYLPELLAVCDSIAVMTRGRLSPAKPASEWTADSILQAAIGAET
jgi:ribose transport system ATP-binding protein